MKYLLKLGKASRHRYPVGQKICRNPTSKFLFYKENSFKKYSYITLSLTIVLYVYLILPILCFAFFVKNLKIEYYPNFGGGEIFLENWRVVSSHTLQLENFDEIALFHTVKEI